MPSPMMTWSGHPRQPPVARLAPLAPQPRNALRHPIACLRRQAALLLLRRRPDWHHRRASARPLVAYLPRRLQRPGNSGAPRNGPLGMAGIGAYDHYAGKDWTLLRGRAHESPYLRTSDALLPSVTASTRPSSTRGLVTILDAASGNTIAEVEGTAGTSEILVGSEHGRRLPERAAGRTGQTPRRRQAGRRRHGRIRRGQPARSSGATKAAQSAPWPWPPTTDASSTCQERISPLSTSRTEPSSGTSSSSGLRPRPCSTSTTSSSCRVVRL